MTRFAAPAIYACPGCALLLTRPRFASMNFYDHTDWSDGSPTAWFIGRSAGLVRCPACVALFFIQDIADIGLRREFPQRLSAFGRRLARWTGDRDGKLRDNEEWDALPSSVRDDWQARDAGLKDLLFVLADPRDLGAARLLGLRKGVWWRLNDRFRGALTDGLVPDAPLLPVDEEQANTEAILGLLEAVDDTPGVQVQRGELLRHLGRFDEAVRVLKSVPADGRTEIRASKIERLARAGDRAVRAL